MRTALISGQIESYSESPFLYLHHAGYFPWFLLAFWCFRFQIELFDAPVSNFCTGGRYRSNFILLNVVSSFHSSIHWMCCSFSGVYAFPLEYQTGVTTSPPTDFPFCFICLLVCIVLLWYFFYFPEVLWYILKCAAVIFLVFSLLRNVLAIWDLLWLHTNFKMHFSISVNNAVDIFLMWLL